MNFNEKLVEQFEQLLIEEDKNENDIQAFLEKNTELIPTPILLNHYLHFNVIISKLKIGGGYVTDFAYLTKSSDMWNLVLVELEDSKKNIFLKNDENIKFSSMFNNAYDQIMEWKAYLNDNKCDVLKNIDKLRVPLKENLIKIKYVLVIGRNNEKNSNERRRRMFAEKSNEDIRLMTYDSLISSYKNNFFNNKKIILSQWREGFEIKATPNNLKTHIFAYIKKEHLKINEGQIKILEKQDYQIKKWISGKVLSMNGKWDKESFIEKNK